MSTRGLGELGGHQSVDDANGSFSVSVNGGPRHSLWPPFAGVPAGRSVVDGEAARAACLHYVEQNWTDIRSQSRCGLAPVRAYAA
ncbi:MAG: MbtH family protein [Mycobacterium sp.]